MSRRRPGRGTAMAMIAVGVFAAVLVPMSSTAAGTDPFAAVDASMRARVRADRLDGGVVFVANADRVLHLARFGSVRPSTEIPIASASKWLTAATLMTLVDEGRVTLDTPVGDVLPGFRGAKRTVTLRHLLAHTSGLASDACIGDPTTTTAACTERIAAGPDPATVPGTHFSYSSTGYEVVGRVIEVLSGSSFEEAFEARIARPVGMTDTRFDAVAGRQYRHPAPAASAVSTVDDYARFLTMLTRRGEIDGRRVLSPASVTEIERDQVAGLDTRGDAAVRITNIPTYGLGVWRDVVGRDDDARVVSGNGAYGFYPWIDRRHATFGIIGVADVSSGSEHAVPASQRQARRSWRAAARNA